MKVVTLALIATLVWSAPLLAEPGDSTTRLALKLLSRMPADKNAAVSPFSLQTVFAMVASGAKGVTESEIVEGLDLEPGYSATFKDRLAILAQDGAEVSIANRLWPSTRFRLKAAYTALCRDVFGAEPVVLDYSRTEHARKTINSWVAEATRDKIPELLRLSFLSADTVLVLTNALYFKGKWASNFNAADTRPAVFTSPGGPMEVLMMSHQKPHAYFENAAMQAVRLDYTGSDFSMTILLPKKADGLKTLRDGLGYPLVSDLFDQEAEPVNLRLSLPRFNVRGSLDVIPAMQSLGVHAAFSAGADFSRMSDSPGLYIGEAVHQAVVEVNEEGTVGAAATAVAVSRSMPRKDVTMKVDHPFLFLVSDSRGTVLFAGQVVAPNRAE